MAEILIANEAPSRWVSIAAAEPRACAEAIRAVAAGAGCYPSGRLDLTADISRAMWEQGAGELNEESFGAVLHGLLQDGQQQQQQQQGQQQAGGEQRDGSAGAVQRALSPAVSRRLSPSNSNLNLSNGSATTSGHLLQLLGMDDNVPEAAAATAAAAGESGASTPQGSSHRIHNQFASPSAATPAGASPASASSSSRHQLALLLSGPLSRVPATSSQQRAGLQPAAAVSDHSASSGCEEGLALVYLLLSALATKPQPQQPQQQGQAQLHACSVALLRSEAYAGALQQQLRQRGLGSLLTAAALRCLWVAISAVGADSPATAIFCQSDTTTVLLESFSLRTVRAAAAGSPQQAVTVALRTLLLIIYALWECPGLQQAQEQQQAGRGGGTSRHISPVRGSSPGHSSGPLRSGSRLSFPSSKLFSSGSCVYADNSRCSWGSVPLRQLPQWPLQRLLAGGGYLAGMLEVVGSGACGPYTEDMLPLLNQLSSCVPLESCKDAERIARLPRVGGAQAAADMCAAWRAAGPPAWLPAASWSGGVPSI